MTRTRSTRRYRYVFTVAMLALAVFVADPVGIADGMTATTIIGRAMLAGLLAGIATENFYATRHWSKHAPLSPISKGPQRSMLSEPRMKPRTVWFGLALGLFGWALIGAVCVLVWWLLR